MSELEIIKAKLEKQREFLKEKYFVEKIGIFGSISKGMEAPDSDIDIFVEFNGPIGWDFVELKEYLENLFERKVDLIIRKTLKPQIASEVLDEVIYV